MVGWQGRPDFAADAFEAFYCGSAGVLRRFNLLAGRVMLHAAIERLDLIDARTVQGVLRDLHADLPLMVPADPMPIAVSVGAPPPPSAPAPVTAHPRWFASAPAPTPAREPQVAVTAHGWFQPAETSQVKAAYSSPPRHPGPVPDFSPVGHGRHPGGGRGPGGNGRDEGQRSVAWVTAPGPRPSPGNDMLEGDEGRPVPESTAPREQPSVALLESWMAEQSRHDEVEEAGQGGSNSNLADRIARLEGRVEEQEEALRRVLTLLVDWVEADDRAAPAVQPVPIRGAATWIHAA